MSRISARKSSVLCQYINVHCLGYQQESLQYSASSSMYIVKGISEKVFSTLPVHQCTLSRASARKSSVLCQFINVHCLGYQQESLQYSASSSMYIVKGISEKVFSTLPVHQCTLSRASARKSSVLCQFINVHCQGHQRESLQYSASSSMYNV